jgi:hypothetical protein
MQNCARVIALRWVCRRAAVTVIFVAAAAWIVAYGGAIAAAADVQPAAPTPAENQTGPAKIQTAPSASDTWRYRRHEGLWWYWTVADRWVYWVDGRWVDYDPKTYAQFKASRAPRTSNSVRGGQGDWGQWGPVRYDRYGQPQYPYSMRTRGMRQLGPVPTPAGVRSLPGWGGER